MLRQRMISRMCRHLSEGTRLPLQWRNKDGVRNALSDCVHCTDSDRLRNCRGTSAEATTGEEEAPEDDVHNGASQEELPAELTKLFVEKEGFCNYYFNDLQQQQLLKPMREAIGSNVDPGTVWAITFNSQDSALTSAVN